MISLLCNRSINYVANIIKAHTYTRPREKAELHIDGERVNEWICVAEQRGATLIHATS